MTQVPVETTGMLLSEWRLTIAWPSYLVLCLLTSVAARLLVSFFKAFEMKTLDEAAPYGQRLWQAFLSKATAKDEQMRDYWLTAIIGFAEAAAYPVLLFTKEDVVIGAWLAIKTAGQWGGWAKSRTAFNRFLVGNLLVLAVAYFWLSRYLASK